MRILLDTHIALWAIADTSKLSDEVTELLEKESNEVFYSMASVWEVAIKHIIKPENMPVSEEEFVRLCEDTGFTRLPIEAGHIFLSIIENSSEITHILRGIIKINHS